MKKLLLKYAKRRLEQCLFLIIFAVTLVNLYVSSKKVHY